MDKAKKVSPRAFEIIIWILAVLNLVWMVGVVYYQTDILGQYFINDNNMLAKFYSERYSAYTLYLLPILLVIGLIAGRSKGTKLLTLVFLVAFAALYFQIHSAIDGAGLA